MRYSVTSSGSQNADAQIQSNPSRLHAVQLISDGTNAASVSVYSGTTTGGLLLATVKVAATTSSPSTVVFFSPVDANNGIFADVAGTGATYIVYYSLGC